MKLFEEAVDAILLKRVKYPARYENREPTKRELSIRWRLRKRHKE